MRSCVRFVIPLLLLAGAARAQEPADDECTVGVAAGKATADGRPLLWKNRDTHQRDNVVLALADGRLPYFALCDAGRNDVVWGGANLAGFCILNAVSRDLPDGNREGPANGAFMKRALQECESVAQFEALLTATNDNGRRTRANFGVIDAFGEAAFFEAGHASFRRFDAASEASGVLVRTNFATSANGERGRERCVRAGELLRQANAKPLTTRFLLQQLLRDLQPPPSAAKGDKGRLDARETIHRQNTVAGLVLHGVARGDDPKWTVMWALLGPPLFTVAVPLFPAAGAVPADVAGAPRSPLCDAARRLADAHYETAAASGAEAADEGEAEVAGALRWLRADRVAPVRRTILFAEADILARHDEALANWRQGGKPPPKQMRLYQDAMAKLALQHVRDLADQHAPVPAGK
jgi:hypothetical protein